MPETKSDKKFPWIILLCLHIYLISSFFVVLSQEVDKFYPLYTVSVITSFLAFLIGWFRAWLHYYSPNKKKAVIRGSVAYILVGVIFFISFFGPLNGYQIEKLKMFPIQTTAMLAGMTLAWPIWIGFIVYALISFADFR